MSKNRKTALLIIDVQNGMFAFPKNQPHDGDDLIKTINTLITTARAAERPIIFVQHDGAGEHPLVPGSKGHKISEALYRLPSDPVVRKTECGSFNETKLLETLIGLNVEHLVICGLQTEFCVDTTIRSASDHGFDITVPEGGHSTFDSESLKATEIIEHHQNIWTTAFGTVKAAKDIDFAGVKNV